MASIENKIDLIAHNPFQYPSYKGDLKLRKAVVHHTFIVIFETFDSYIKIVDIYHGKRDI